MSDVIDFKARREAKEGTEELLALTCSCGCDRMMVLYSAGSDVPRIQCGNCATVLSVPDVDPAA